MAVGIMDRFFSVLQNNPSVAAGGATFAIAFALVAGNAFYAQSGAHPDPIWATRDMTTTQSLEPAVRPVRTSSVQPKTIPVPTASGMPRPAIERSRLIEDIQAALLRTGEFNGTVDGLNGPVTREAISAFQKRKGLPQTGNASHELLALIQQGLPSAIPVRHDDALSKVINDGGQSAKPALDRDVVRRIQQGLANATGLEIDIDGILGNQTETALRAFQRKNGLRETGKPDQATLDKLLGGSSA